MEGGHQAFLLLEPVDNDVSLFLGLLRLHEPD
jgi:hypothetical protein